MFKGYAKLGITYYIIYDPEERPEGDTKVKLYRVRRSARCVALRAELQLDSEPVAHATGMDLPPSGLSQLGSFFAQDQNTTPLATQ